MWRPNTPSISPASKCNAGQEGLVPFIYGFLNKYQGHTAPFKHFSAEGQMRQQQGWWLMCSPHHQAPVAVLGSAQPNYAGAEGPVLLCWSKAIQLPAVQQTHPSVQGGSSCSSLPPQRQAAGLLLSTGRPTPHPQLLHLLSCGLDRSASILRG